MKKRLYYISVAALVFFGLGLWLHFGTSQEDFLMGYAARIQSSLHHREAEIKALLRDTILTEWNLNKPFEKQQEYLAHLNSLLDRPYNVVIYNGDSLAIWLNNLALPHSQMVRELAAQRGETTRLVHFPNGYFELLKHTLPDGRMALGLIPIRMEYGTASENLPNKFFATGSAVPEMVSISQLRTVFPIVNSQGKTLTWIDATGPIQDRAHLVWVLLCYVLGFLALAIIINDVSLQLARKHRPWVGAAFMLGAVIGLRWLTIELGFAAHFSTFETFRKVFNSESLRSMDSLGELLINILLLVWMMVFFNREFQIKQYHPPFRWVGMGLSTLHFLAVNLGLVMVVNIFRIIIVDSNIVFDFENVFALDLQSVLAILGIILLLLSLYLFSHRMLLAIHNIGLPKTYRIATLFLSLLITLPLVGIGNIGIRPEFFLLGALAYLLIFEIFSESQVMTLGWLVVWLMLFSAFTALLLYKFNFDKDINYRKNIAAALTDFRDTLAEARFAGLSEQLNQTPALKEWNALAELNAHDWIPKEVAREFISKYVSEDKYLLLNYYFSISGFYYDNGTPAFTEQIYSLGNMEQLFQTAIPTRAPDIRFLDTRHHEPGYLLRLQLPSSVPLIVFVKFRRSFSEPSKVYTELLLNSQYKNLPELDRYDYGIYIDSLLVEEHKKSYPQVLNVVPPGKNQYYNPPLDRRRSELIYQAGDGTVIIIGRSWGGYVKPFSLFSYVFVLLTLAVLVFSLINYYTDALPGPLNFFRNSRPSLRKQFQLWVVGMILLTFLGIGYVTVEHFQRSSEDYLRGRLERKVASALANVSYELKTWHRKQSRSEEKTTSSAQMQGNSLSSLLPLLSDVHQLDVNIFDLKGFLLTSSEMEIFRKGFVAPLMGAFAYQELKHLRLENSSQLERIGSLNYLAAYVPVKDLNGEPMAFMGIPYYAVKKELASDVTAFMSTLLNVYVFLLLFTGGLAIFIANSVTKALSDLSTSIQKLRLSYNEPIEWKRNDEIGDLVQAYNNAVRKIEESSRELAQSEREGAWREMAKQVAHEIKNPLTPMKLSIQYLQLAIKNGEKDLEALIKRVSDTLIEQIDVLSRIATEFSSFAKMPKAENTLFSLNELTKSVYTLFANERLDMDISLLLPGKDFVVYADRNHITRVLNNFFKNAIQAIPDERHGVIELSLQQENNQVVMSLKDNGTGIPADIQDKVFVPNYSTKSTGAGLGLAICKNIVELAGGDIYFETEEGVGTTFIVKLPIAEVREVDLK